MNLTIDSELPNGIAPVLMSYFNINPIRDKVLAEAANQQDRPDDIAKDPFVTSSSRFTPFIAAYDLCIIDVSDVLTLPVHRLAKLIENAWIDLQLQRKREDHVRIKEDDSHTISFPDSLTLVHPQTGVKYYAESLGSMLLVKGLEHLKEDSSGAIFARTPFRITYPETIGGPLLPIELSSQMNRKNTCGIRRNYPTGLSTSAGLAIYQRRH